MFVCLFVWVGVCVRACVRLYVRVCVTNSINNVPVGSYHRQTDDKRQTDSEAGEEVDK